MSTIVATNRLSVEHKNWRKDHPVGFHACPEKRQDNPFNLMKWEAWIPGAADSDWADGVYKLIMTFPENYPTRPPKCQFVPPLYHPNVDPSGTVDLPILDVDEDWRPTVTIKTILLSIQHLLSHPDTNHPERITPTEVVISYAGNAQVNGTYVFTGWMENARMYERRGPFIPKLPMYQSTSTEAIEDARFVIYKCVTISRQCQWFISVVADGTRPGTAKDIDIYNASEETKPNVHYGQTLPPKVWTKFEKDDYVNSVYPGPRSEYVLSEAYEDYVGNRELYRDKVRNQAKRNASNSQQRDLDEKSDPSVRDLEKDEAAATDEATAPTSLTRPLPPQTNTNTENEKEKEKEKRQDEGEAEDDQNHHGGSASKKGESGKESEIMHAHPISQRYVDEKTGPKENKPEQELHQSATDRAIPTPPSAQAKAENTAATQVLASPTACMLASFSEFKKFTFDTSTFGSSNVGGAASSFGSFGATTGGASTFGNSNVGGAAPSFGSFGGSKSFSKIIAPILSTVEKQETTKSVAQPPIAPFGSVSVIGSAAVLTVSAAPLPNAMFDLKGPQTNTNTKKENKQDEDVEENYQCGICLDVLTDPITLPCGHTWCKSCILDTLKVRSRCPNCKKTVPDSIVNDLCVNIFLRNLIDVKYPTRAAQREKILAEKRKTIAAAKVEITNLEQKENASLIAMIPKKVEYAVAKALLAVERVEILTAKFHLLELEGRLVELVDKGGKYSGQVNALGKRHGIGKTVYSNGDIVIAEWKDGKYHDGPQKYIFSSGEVLRVDESQQPYMCSYTCTDHKYLGECNSNGISNGWGRVTLANGTVSHAGWCDGGKPVNNDAIEKTLLR